MTTTFTPTYLYIKEHTITGKKYFGKTTAKDPFRYLGSGSEWTRHIKEHGKEHVSTIWCQLFTDKDELVKYALEFSEENNIVSSDAWLNLIPENGTGGGLCGIGSRAKWTDEAKKQRSTDFTGDKNPFYGKKHRESSKRYGTANSSTRPEVREKMSGPRPGFLPHNHFNGWDAETKKKIQDSLVGRKASAETREKLKQLRKDVMWVHDGVNKPRQVKSEIAKLLINEDGFKPGRGPKSFW